MRTTDDVTFGRKCYFLCPHDAVRTDLVFEIIRNEFEVYVIDEPGVAREIVSNTSSILFVNIDAPDADWQTYLIEMKGDPSFARVGLGVVTTRSDPALRNLYIMEIGVDCGVVTLQPQLHNVAHIVMEILRSNDAIGRRNAVRVCCQDDPTIACSLQAGTESLTASVVNLSSQGIACTGFSPRDPRPREFFSRISVRLRDEEAVLSGRLFDVREDADDKLYVLLYDRGVDSAEREKVHRFVQLSLQENVNRRLDGLKRNLERRRRRRIVRMALLAVVSLAAVAGVLVFLL